MIGETPLSIVIVRPCGRDAKFQRDKTRQEKVHAQKQGNGQKDITNPKTASNQEFRRLTPPAYFNRVVFEPRHPWPEKYGL
jgi:hypothetical protein